LQLEETTYVAVSVRTDYGDAVGKQALENLGPRELDAPATLHAGELEIRPADGLVLATGEPLTLSVREFELLVAMARREGAIATREQLYGEAWQSELKPGDRSVDVYVSRLRRKLKRAMPDRRFIHTHPGFGYRFQPDR
jgi:DNA-binding response OmpR family regulator